jgi:short-subunit dehydrogenase
MAVTQLAERIKPQIWINNAGILGAAQALHQPKFEIDQIIAVNLTGVITGSVAAARVMIESGGGAILNIGSLSSWNPTPGLAVYAASKHGVRAFSGALGAELSGTGVVVKCICPDGIWTPMLEAVIDDPNAAMPFSGRHLLKADDVAEAAVILLEKRSLLLSLPKSRAFLARLSGRYPTLGVATYRRALAQGKKGQAKVKQ